MRTARGSSAVQIKTCVPGRLRVHTFFCTVPGKGLEGIPVNFFPGQVLQAVGLRLNGGKAQGENGLQGVAGRDGEQRGRRPLWRYRPPPGAGGLESSSCPTPGGGPSGAYCSWQWHSPRSRRRFSPDRQRPEWRPLPRPAWLRNPGGNETGLPAFWDSEPQQTPRAGGPGWRGRGALRPKWSPEPFEEWGIRCTAGCSGGREAG